MQTKYIIKWEKKKALANYGGVPFDQKKKNSWVVLETSQFDSKLVLASTESIFLRSKFENLP